MLELSLNFLDRLVILLLQLQSVHLASRPLEICNLRCGWEADIEIYLIDYCLESLRLRLLSLLAWVVLLDDYLSWEIQPHQVVLLIVDGGQQLFNGGA